MSAKRIEVISAGGMCTGLECLVTTAVFLRGFWKNRVGNAVVCLLPIQVEVDHQCSLFEVDMAMLMVTVE